MDSAMTVPEQVMPNIVGHPKDDIFSSFVEPSLSVTLISSQVATGDDVPDLASLEVLIKSSKVKRLIRKTDWPVCHETRRCLWLKLCNASYDCKVVSDASAYNEAVKNIFGEGNAELHGILPLPPFADRQYQERRYLTDAGVEAVKRILCVIANERPDITYSPVLFTITCLLLHYLDEATTYSCVSALLRSKQRYITQTSIAYRARVLVLQDLSRKYAVSEEFDAGDLAYQRNPDAIYLFIWSVVQKSWYNTAAKTLNSMNDVFTDWHWWLLKDLPFPYLVRVFDCFLLEGPKVLYRVALSILIHFNKQVIAKKKKTQSSEQNIQIEAGIRRFCADIKVPVQKLLKTAFKLRGLSRSEIGKILLKKEMYVQSQLNAEALMGTLPPSQSTGSLSIVVGQEVKGNIISRGEWREIYKWLPKRYTLCQPSLIFSTHEHGTSLNTLYGKICGYEPTFMAIKTDSGEVIGAFCSTDWVNRTDPRRGRVYFGTGESFICQLLPSRIKYPWVGLTHGDKTPHSAQLFFSGDNTQIAIGGGGSGTAILLDENLNRGRSQSCETFDNAPLVSTADGYFFAVVLEVFAFN